MKQWWGISKKQADEAPILFINHLHEPSFREINAEKRKISLEVLWIYQQCGTSQTCADHAKNTESWPIAEECPSREISRESLVKGGSLQSFQASLQTSLHREIRNEQMENRAERLLLAIKWGFYFFSFSIWWYCQVWKILSFLPTSGLLRVGMVD